MRRVHKGRYAMRVSVVSMTGYGAASQAWSPEQGRGRGRVRVDVEVRSVNARFLEIKVRQPFGPSAERALRAVAERHVGRGRVDLSVFVRRDRAPEDASEDPLDGLGVDPQRVATVARAAAQINALAAREGLELATPSSLEILRFLSSSKPVPSETTTEVPPFLEALADTAIRELAEFRRREGGNLETALGELADQLERCAQTLAAGLPDESARLHTRIETRLTELTSRAQVAAIDPQRVAQEVAVVVARGDVEEELARIASHLEQMRTTLGAEPGAGQGKTLDFVTQELLREFTTMGSKLTSHEGSRIVIDAKSIIERIREQVQNVE